MALESHGTDWMPMCTDAACTDAACKDAACKDAGRKFLLPNVGLSKVVSRNEIFVVKTSLNSPI
jgi:hypothetical protein